MFDQLNSHLNNIAMASTNKKEAIAQLAANNTKLTALTSIQYGRIEQVLKTRSSSDSAAAVTSNPSNGKNSVFQLRHALKSKWVVGAYCSTHGWGTSHNSPDCPKKGQGHVNTATPANPSRPGIICNKAWDNFYST